MTSVRLARLAMRVRFEIVLWGDDPAHLMAAGEEALDEIERVESQLSPYEPTSDLFALNAADPGTPVRLLPTTLAFLQRAAELTAATGGAFDLTVGPLLAAWGLWESASEEPDAGALESVRQRVGMDRCVHLDLTEGTVTLLRSGVRLHPGAIGKGWALDRAAALLRDQEIARVLLHGGTSSALAIGGPFDVQIAGSERTVTLHDSALGVSGAYGKSVVVGGVSRGHIVDPSTGFPSGEVRLAVVHADSATLADAASTALLVRGSGEFLSQEGIRQMWVEPN